MCPPTPSPDRPPYQHVVTSGLPYERGFSHGQQAKLKVQANVEYYRIPGKLSHSMELMNTIIHQVYIPALKSYYPSGYDEMRGIADGADVTLEDIVLLNSRYDLARLGDDGATRPVNGHHQHDPEGAEETANECTSAFFPQESTANNDVLVAQNWDMSSRLWENDCVIYLEVHPDPSENKPSLFMVTEAGQLGRSGMSSAGIGVAANSLMSSEDYVPVPYVDAGGQLHDRQVQKILPISMLRRMILESNHLAEALTAAYNFPRHVSNNLTIGTAEGFGLCLEVTPQSIFKVYKSNRDNYLVHGNHFVHPGFLSRSGLSCKYPGGSSWFRQRRLEALVQTSAQEGTITQDSIIEALSDHLSFPESLCVHPDRNPIDAVIRHLPGYPFRGISATIACVMYNLTKREVTRRVKCDGAAAPCANCRRLSIKCIPSFSSNFRTWATSSHDAPSSPTLQPPEAPIPHSLCAPDAPFEICAGTEKDPVGGGTVDGHPSAILSGEEWSMTTDGLEGPLCSTPSPCCASSVRVDGDELDMLCGIGLTTKNIQPLHNTIEEYDAILQMRNGLIEFPFVGCSGPDSAAGQHTTPPSSLSISDFRDRDRLAEHYNGHLIGFLSVKTTTWNFYSYILQKVQKGPDSTLKHGVLAWAESHRSWSRRPAAACPGPHYLKADACLRQLQEELTGLPTDMMSGYNVLDKLNSLLATSLFLSHCDVMYGDHESLISRLDSLKRYLTPRWHSLMEIATGVQLRVLIWLAYLDLRATLWTVPSASSQPTDYAPRDRVGDLFDLLRGSRTDDSVRQLKDSKYYLVECFGSIYPEQELRNDLSEEPWKLLSDDAMILFCDIKAFYGWCHQLTLARKPHGLYDELREAKIRALRSDIARIRAECNQIHSEELQAGHGFDYAARVQSHFLRCTCLHLSATILLNRINNPDVRTDSESQEAAREIIQITQQLKKAGDLRFPRSIAWPLPLFLAGIEVEDEVYQDWVLAFMEGLSEWGGSVMKATALLRQIMDKQAVEGVRISPWHAMMELGETIIV